MLRRTFRCLPNRCKQIESLSICLQLLLKTRAGHAVMVIERGVFEQTQQAPRLRVQNDKTTYFMLIDVIVRTNVKYK